MTAKLREALHQVVKFWDKSDPNVRLPVGWTPESWLPGAKQAIAEYDAQQPQTQAQQPQTQAQQPQTQAQQPSGVLDVVFTPDPAFIPPGAAMNITTPQTAFQTPPIAQQLQAQQYAPQAQQYAQQPQAQQYAQQPQYTPVAVAPNWMQGWPHVPGDYYMSLARPFEREPNQIFVKVTPIRGTAGLSYQNGNIPLSRNDYDRAYYMPAVLPPPPR